MAFKGTKTRSSRQIVEEIENVGGDLNAATATETTAYYARVLKADVPLALDVLSDILANPVFEAEEVEREKSVIEQEIGAAQDTPDDVIFEHMSELAFPGQPMGRSLLGTAESLKAFTGDTLHGYLAEALPRAGHGGRRRRRRRARHGGRGSRASALRRSPARRRRQPAPANFGGGSRIVRRDLEQAHLTFGLEGVSQTDPALFSLQVFSNILGGGMSSRLFQEVREKRGLCYSIYTFHMPYSDTGFFGLYTGTDPADAPEMMDVVVDQMKAAVETLTETEVQRAKAQMKAGLLMALESCGARAEQLARHILMFGRPLTNARWSRASTMSRSNSTRAAAQALLARSRPAVVALGTGRGLSKAVKLAEGLTDAPDRARYH